jgi:uncharacterized protein (DUF1800 family)
MLFLVGCGASGPEAASEDGASGAPPSGPTGTIFSSREGVAVFMGQAAFGARPDDLDRWNGAIAEDWFEAQLTVPPSFMRPAFDIHMDRLTTDGFSGFRIASPTLIFWENAVGAPDQLRQRMAFALSQILVTSASTGTLNGTPEGMIYYQDLLIEHAFGNYRDLLHDVTYSPAMGYYLTYLGSKKADPDTGEMPDENYARELLQLFTIGVDDIDMQGRPTGAGELYDNDDITELAKVFTGFEYAFRARTGAERRERMQTPLVIDEDDHSPEAKSFLGLTIPAGTSPASAVEMTLDHLMDQPTMAPFLARQLIQRFVTSHPSPDYVGRVAQAFDTGRYQLPNMVSIGQGRKGDLAATIAAVLFDREARDIEASRANREFGKIREPVLRLAHWARAFEVDAGPTEYVFDLYNTSDTDRLAQHPHRAPSVFNFYRPGYVAPGTLTGDQNLTMPEMQLVSTATTPGYVNFVDNFILADRDDRDLERIEDRLRRFNVDLPAAPGVNAWVAEYGAELDLLDTPEALIDRLDLILTSGTMSEQTRTTLREYFAAEAEGDGPDTSRQVYVDRIQFGVLLVMTSPDYLIQR